MTRSDAPTIPFAALAAAHEALRMVHRSAYGVPLPQAVLLQVAASVGALNAHMPCLPVEIVMPKTSEAAQ